MNHIYIFLTIFFTVYGQLVIKWQVSQVGAFPPELIDKLLFLGKLLLNPWIITGFASAFLASLAWVAAMTKFTLSYAYPFTSLSFVLVIILSSVLFQDSISVSRAGGIAFIILGLILSSRS
jgi:multidrug transporter EmrE-like cation transporter